MRKSAPVVAIVFIAVLLCLGCMPSSYAPSLPPADNDNSSSEIQNPTTPPSGGGDNTDTPAEIPEETPKIKVKAIDIPLCELRFAIGVNPEDTELKEAINAVISEALQNGTIAKIAEKYFDTRLENERVTVEPEENPDPHDGDFTVNVNASAEPFEYTTDKHLSGVNVEIIKYVADKLGKRLVLRNVIFEEVFDLSRGADACVIAISSDYYGLFGLASAENHYNADQIIIVKEDNTVFDSCKTKSDMEKALQNLSGGKIGYRRGTAGAKYVLGDRESGFAGLKNLTPVEYDGAADAVRDLQDGKIDFVITDKTPADNIINRANS